MTRVNIPNELVEQIKRGNGVLFIGAGLSMGAGLPSWEQLVRPLGETIDAPPNTDLLRVAQYYEDGTGRQALLERIMEATDTAGKRPTENHRLLAALPITTWITTNYDNFLEKTLDEAGIRFRKVVRNENVPYRSADRHTLIKMHGDRQQPDTIVITEEDYHTYYKKYLLVKTQLAALAATSTFLFIGYSVSDPDFNQIHAEIAFDLQKHQKKAYAILFDADKFVMRNLDKRNIIVINIPMEGQTNYSARLGEVLRELVQRCGGQVPVAEPQPVTTLEQRESEPEPVPTPLVIPQITDIQREEIEHLWELITIHRGNLRHLKRQESQFGKLQVPSHIMNQIRGEEREIKRLLITICSVLGLNYDEVTRPVREGSVSEIILYLERQYNLEQTVGAILEAN